MAVLENRYIYLHGFASGPQSTKAQFLRHCWQKRGLAMEIPDLNGDDFSSLTLTRQIVQVGQLIEQSQLPVTQNVGLKALGFTSEMKVSASIERRSTINILGSLGSPHIF